MVPTVNALEIKAVNITASISKRHFSLKNKAACMDLCPGGKTMRCTLQTETLESIYRANGRGGFGSQTAADARWRPPRNPEKQTVGTVTASHKMLAMQAFSSSLNASTANFYREVAWAEKAFG